MSCGSNNTCDSVGNMDDSIGAGHIAPSSTISCCTIHPSIQMRRRMRNGEWRQLVIESPLCSADSDASDWSNSFTSLGYASSTSPSSSHNPTPSSSPEQQERSKMIPLKSLPSNFKEYKVEDPSLSPPIMDDSMQGKCLQYPLKEREVKIPALPFPSEVSEMPQGAVHELSESLESILQHRKARVHELKTQRIVPPPPPRRLSDIGHYRSCSPSAKEQWESVTSFGSDASSFRSEIAHNKKSIMKGCNEKHMPSSFYSDMTKRMSNLALAESKEDICAVSLRIPSYSDSSTNALSDSHRMDSSSLEISYDSFLESVDSDNSASTQGSSTLMMWCADKRDFKRVLSLPANMESIAEYEVDTSFMKSNDDLHKALQNIWGNQSPGCVPEAKMKLQQEKESPDQDDISTSHGDIDCATAKTRTTTPPQDLSSKSPSMDGENVNGGTITGNIRGREPPSAIRTLSNVPNKKALNSSKLIPPDPSPQMQAREKMRLHDERLINCSVDSKLQTPHTGAKQHHQPPPPSLRVDLPASDNANKSHQSMSSLQTTHMSNNCPARSSNVHTKDMGRRLSLPSDTGKENGSSPQKAIPRPPAKGGVKRSSSYDGRDYFMLPLPMKSPSKEHVTPTKREDGFANERKGRSFLTAKGAKKQPLHRNATHTPESDDSADSKNASSKADANGRCIRHPHIQLVAKKRGRGLKIRRRKAVMVFCKECHLEEERNRRRQEEEESLPSKGRPLPKVRKKASGDETCATMSMTESESSSTLSKDQGVVPAGILRKPASRVDDSSFSSKSTDSDLTTTFSYISSLSGFSSTCSSSSGTSPAPSNSGILRNSSFGTPNKRSSVDSSGGSSSKSPKSGRVVFAGRDDIIGVVRFAPDPE